MIDLDHEEKRGSPFCPLMGEDCTSGWTPKMGKKKCVAWRGIPMVDLKTNRPKEVYACGVYEWPIFQAFEITTLLQQNRAGIDKVASEMSGVKGAISIINESFCNAAQVALEMKERSLRALTKSEAPPEK